LTGEEMAPGSSVALAGSRDATRSSALEAARELLANEGLVGVTMAAVATRAGVDESVVSRWWPTEDALALDVLRHEYVVLVNRIRRRSCTLRL
jgi:AcrR family transcriptional regulator